MNHEFYECKTCSNYHPIEFDKVAKQTMRRNFTNTNYTPQFEILNSLLIAPSKGKIESIVKLHKQRLKQQFSIELKADPKNRQMMEYDRRNYEGLFYIAKCTRLKERVCLKELEKLMAFDPNFENKQYFSFEARMMAETVHSVWTRRVSIFTEHPTKHWVEVTDRCKLNFNPVWFPGSTVYKFPVQLTKGKLTNGIYDDCVGSFRINGKLEQFLRINLERTKIYQRGEKKSLFDSQMGVVYFQVAYFDAVFTELRLVYQWFETKPRVYIRVPMSSKVMPDLKVADMIPIYTARKQKLVEETLERMMSRAKSLEPLNRKLAEHKRIMERLSKLEK